MVNLENYNIELFHNATVIDQGSRNKQKFHLLKSAVDAVQVSGLNCEFGVHEGFTINRIAQFVGDETVFGFDSFEGLPETWSLNNHKTLEQGHFAVETLPKVAPNVQLVRGWFDASIPKWQEEHTDTVKFIHIDCDLYSSAKTVLSLLNKQIVLGTVIVFDEFYYWARPTEYTNWVEHEYLALKEWIEENDREFEILFRNNYFQCAIRIIK
jgi:hypothetical protein